MPADLSAILDEGERLCREATFPECKHVEQGRVFIRNGGLLITVREQIPADVDPDGDDPEAWRIGDEAVELAGRRGECVAFALNHLPLLLRLARALLDGAKTHSCACDILDTAAFDAAREGRP